METFFYRDKDNPNWGWIVYFGADRLYHALDYVRRPQIQETCVNEAKR